MDQGWGHRDERDLGGVGCRGDLDLEVGKCGLMGFLVWAWVGGWGNSACAGVCCLGVIVCRM